MSDAEVNRRALNQHAFVDWVSKPFDSDKLVSLVKQRLKKTVDNKV
jgi:DNA-binding NtrC family response regulator